jgi:parallel beta-helix repeat protein
VVRIRPRNQAGTGNLIANNVIANNHGRGISMHDNDGLAVSDTTVTHNTIVFNGSTGILVNVNAGTGNIIANNVLADNGWICDYKQIRVQAGSSNLIANNIVWSPTSSRCGIENSTSTNTVTGNVLEDPMFVKAYSDLHLLAGSPAIGLALVANSQPTDYEGKPCDSSPDDGAYEY